MCRRNSGKITHKSTSIALKIDRLYKIVMIFLHKEREMLLLEISNGVDDRKSL